MLVAWANKSPSYFDNGKSARIDFHRDRGKGCGPIGQSKTWPEGIRGFLVSRRRLRRRRRGRRRVFRVPMDVGTSVCPRRSPTTEIFDPSSPFLHGDVCARVYRHAATTTTNATLYIYRYRWTCIYASVYLYVG